MLKKLEELVKGGGVISFQEAEELLKLEQGQILELLAVANRVRKHFQGDQVDLCSIINVKSGKCSENCGFCAQSAHHQVSVEVYNLLDKATVSARASLMERAGAHRFALVSSGRGVKEGKELDKIIDLIVTLKQETSLTLCASLGLLTPGAAARLKESGLDRYHHNLETAESYFSEICTTHSYQDRIDTVKVAQEAGLTICSGVILGLGESQKQVIEVAEAIRRLEVDSVPLNILNPIKGTPLGNNPLMDPWQVLKIVAVFRLMMPKTNLRFCGGRETNLRDLQALGMLAGANGLMIGNYLTTAGREPEIDLQMLKDLGFKLHKK